MTTETKNDTAKDVVVSDETYQRLRELEHQMLAELLDMDADVLRVRALFIRHSGKPMPIGEYYALVLGLRKKLASALASVIAAMDACTATETQLAAASDDAPSSSPSPDPSRAQQGSPT